MFVYGGVVYAQKNFTGIDPEKLYRATFICQYGLCCCIVWPSFLFDCFVKIWATYKNFLGKQFTAPLGKKLPVRLCQEECYDGAFGVTKKLCWYINSCLFVSFLQEFGIVDNEEYIDDKETLNLTFRTRKEAKIVRIMGIIHLVNLYFQCLSVLCPTHFLPPFFIWVYFVLHQLIKVCG